MDDDTKEIFIDLSDINNLTGGAEPDNSNNNNMSVIKLDNNDHNDHNNQKEINVNSSDDEESNNEGEQDEINVNSSDNNEQSDNNDEESNNIEGDEEINVNSSDNEQNNENGENEENSNVEEIDLFNNSISEIQVENREVLEEHERIYTDDIYRQLLQNELLSELPIEKQGKKYFQQIVLDTVDKLISLKNEAKEIALHPDDYNTLKANISKGVFDTDRVVPIILDKKVILRVSKFKNEDDEEIEESINHLLHGNLDGYHTEYQLDIFKHEFDIIKKYKDGEIKYDEYYQQIYNLRKAYLIDTNDGKGYKYTNKERTRALRYFNIDTPYWEDREIMGPFEVKYDVIDNYNKQKRTAVKTVIPGEEVNLVGFYINRNNTIWEDLQGEAYVSTSKFGKIGEITKIEVGKNTTTVTLPNHGLINGTKIYIAESNSFPLINGTYKDKVVVIDKDKFTINKVIQNGGDKGIVYTNLMLNIDTYHVKMNDKEQFTIHDKEGKKVDKNIIWRNVRPVKLLFNDIRLKVEQYRRLISEIIPNNKAILENELKELSDINNIKLIRTIIKLKYGVDIYEFSIKVLDSIKHLLRDTIEKQEKSKVYDLKKVKITPQPISDLFADKYMKNPIIVEMYGKYPYYGRRVDSDALRFSWINRKADFGYIYYIIYAMENQLKDKKSDIQKLLTNYKTEMVTVERSIKSEKSKKEYFKEEKECEKYKKQYNSYDQLVEDDTKYQLGDLAIITAKDSKGIRILSKDDGKVFKWEKDGWKKIGKSSFKTLEHLCDFNSVTIKDLSVNKLICLYENKCSNRKVSHLESREDKIKNNLEEIDRLLETIKQSDLSSRYNELLKKYSYLTKSLPVKKKEEEMENKSNNLLTHLLLNKVNRIKSGQLRAYLLYQLIKKDGILVDKYIYSKKYREKMICGHWHYLLLANNVTSSLIQGDIYKKMLDKFGDDGYEVIGIQSCKVCGDYLNISDYDESEGLTRYGEKRVSRAILDERIIDAKTVVEEEQVLDDTYGRINCRDKTFKNLLLNANVPAESINTSMRMCDKLNEISDKIGISLRKKDFVEIIIDVMLTDKPSVSLIKHKKQEMYKLKSKGISLEKINQLDSRGYFQDAYNRYLLNVDNRRVISLAVRTLLAIQSAVPPYIVGKVKVPCSFRGFEGEHGVQFMACTVRKMNIVFEGYRVESGKFNLRPLSEQKTIDQTWYHYKRFRDISKISMALQRRTESDRNRKTVIRKVEDIKETEELPFGKDIKIEVDFASLIKKSKEVEPYYEQYLEHRLYLERELIKKIFELYYGSEVDMMNPEINSVSMGACCLSPASDDNTYDFINSKTDNETKKLREKLNDLNKYKLLFLDRGSFTYNVESSDRQFNCYNDNSLYKCDTAGQIILDKFLYFCSIGVSRGERHIFTILGQCIKCTQRRNEILKSNYTVVQYYELLDSIKVKNSMGLKRKLDLSHLENFDTVRYDCTQNYDSLMTQFVNKLSTLLRKDNDHEFVTKYLTIIQNLGFFKNELLTLQKKVKDDDDEKSKIIYFMSVQKQRVKNIKNYINNYFRKYISAIGNEYYKSGYTHIETMNSNSQAEFISQLYVEQNKLEFFFKNNFSSLFKMLKFDYSIEDINNINGYPSIYNYKYTDVLKESEFTYEYASNMLVYMLLVQLNNFFRTDFSMVEVNNENKKIDTNIEKYRIIANFIVKMFDMINEETEIYDVSEDEYNKFEAILDYNHRRKREDKFKKLTEAEKGMIKTQLNLDTIDEYVYSDYTGEGVADKEKENQLEDEALVDTAKDSLSKKLGREPTQNEIETFKESYSQERDTAISEFDENFGSLFAKKEGLNVMEVGDDYGDMPQGTENEGDGFNEFTEAELYGSN